MITVFVTKEGYYVAGEGLEATLKCSPATDDKGNPIFHELHHTYKVMYLALKQVAQAKDIRGDIVVYNDSRIVDELNGNIQPLDDTCKRWQRTIHREIIPSIRSVVSFKKKSLDFVKQHLKIGDKLIPNIDLARVARLTEQSQKERARSTKARVLNKFKRIWNNDKQ